MGNSTTGDIKVSKSQRIPEVAKWTVANCLTEAHPNFHYNHITRSVSSLADTCPFPPNRAIALV